MAEVNSPRGPLNGVRILDLSNPMGQYCGKMLAMLGADVIKVEPHGGDPSRKMGPFFNSETHPEKSLHWFYYNACKRGVTLDLETNEGKERLRQLAAASDILMETNPPGYMGSMGLGYEDLRQANPRLIYASITPFGQTGPWRDFKSSDLVGTGLGGLLYVCGWPDLPPVRMYGEQAYHLASLHGATAMLIALYQRHQTGAGQYVDVALHECIPPSLMSTIPTYVETGEINKRKGDRRNLPANGIFPCLDGYVDMRLRNHRWSDFAAWLDSHGMAADLMEEKWKDPWFRIEKESLKHIDAVLAEFTRTKTKQELYEQGVKRGLEAAPTNSPADIARDPQLLAKKFFAPVRHDELGKDLPYMRASFVLSKSPIPPITRAPLIGEHNREIFRQGPGVAIKGSGLQGAEANRPKSGGKPEAASYLPFKGLRVLEFTSAVSGPYVGKILADYGAQVIVVESRSTRKTGGMAREPGPKAKDRTSMNLGHLYNKVATNKLSVAVNLSTPKGIELIKKLVRVTDVIIDNFAPRVLERWGFTYENLSAINQNIIMLRMPTVATTGPFKNQTSSSWNMVAMSGLNSMSGNPGRLPVCTSRYSYADESSSCFNAALTLLSALHWRNQTGEGQYLEASQLEGILALAGLGIFEYMVNGQQPSPKGNRSEYAAPHGVYRCLGNDRWCAISVGTEGEWQAFCAAAGLNDLIKKPEFSTLSERLAHAEDLDRIVESWTAQLTAEDVMQKLQASGVAAGVVQNVADLVDKDPQLKARSYWKESVHPEAGRLVGAGWGFKLSAASPLNGRPPLMGENTDYVLGQVLGMSEDEINELIVEGVLY